jgi:hypothetical protein
VVCVDLKDTLIKASSAASGSFPRLFESIFPHLSSERLRKIISKIHRNCLRFRQASFNQRILKLGDDGEGSGGNIGNLVDAAAILLIKVLLLERIG